MWFVERAVFVCSTYITALISAASAAERDSWRTVVSEKSALHKHNFNIGEIGLSGSP